MIVKVKFEYATILSKDEIYENYDIVHGAFNFDCWSRTPFEQDKTKLLILPKHDEYCDEIYAPYDYICDVCPALKIPRDQLANFKKARRVFINDKPFYILNNYLLAKFSIGRYRFNEYVEDDFENEDNTNYNKSIVKNVVDSWFNANFQDEVEVFIEEWK